MRSHERTLLASLGFNDPDKGDERHDLACRYLAQPKIATSVGRVMGTPPTQREWKDGDYEEEFTLTETPEFRVCQFEFAIQKGVGQYATTVGFVDLILSYEIYSHRKGRTRQRKDYVDQQWRWGEWKDFENDSRRMGSLCVEVKIGRVGVGNILRQINLYREYVSVKRFALVTAFPISEGERLQLRNEDIFHFSLGDAFQRYCAEQEQSDKPSDSPEL